MGAFEPVRPACSASGPGTSYSRSRLIERMPASRAAIRATPMSLAECRRPRRLSSLAENDCAAEAGNPGSRLCHGIAALIRTGVRLESDLRAHGDPEPGPNSVEDPL